VKDQADDESTSIMDVMSSCIYHVPSRKLDFIINDSVEKYDADENASIEML
jgi:hypothetical protein